MTTGPRKEMLERENNKKKLKACGGKYVRLLCIDPEIRSISPHERNVWHKMTLDPILLGKSLVKPVVARLITRSKLQIFVFAKGFFGRLDALGVRHVYALGKSANRDIGEGLNHFHTRRLVFPVVVVEVATACHDDGRVGAMVLENLAKALDVAVSIHESV